MDLVRLEAIMKKFDVHTFPIKGQVSHIHERFHVSDYTYGSNGENIVTDGFNIVISVTEPPGPTNQLTSLLASSDVYHRHIEVAFDDPSTDLRDAMLEALAVVSCWEGKTLIHCGAGCSRSVAVVIFLMCMLYDMTIETAVDIAVKSRPCISPMPCYIEQVEQLLKTCKMSKN